MTFKLGQGDTHTIPSMFIRGKLHNIIGDPRSSLRALMTTIPSRFSMTGTYTQNLMILAHSLLKLSQQQEVGRTVRWRDRQRYDKVTNYSFGSVRNSLKSVKNHTILLF